MVACNLFSGWRVLISRKTEYHKQGCRLKKQETENIMKSKSAVTVGFILVFACMSSVWAQDSAGLKAKVQAFYDQESAFIQAKDLEGLMSLVSDDYQVILAGLDREGAKSLAKIGLSSYDELQATFTPLKIAQSGRFIKVLRDEKVMGRSGGGDWKEMSNKQIIEYLVQEGNSLKSARSADLDKNRLSYIHGSTYKDEESGFSFVVPDGWDIIPWIHPTMQGSVLAVAPDRTSVAMMGYVKTPGITAQQAAEGDENLGKALSKAETYQLYKSGPITFKGHEGFEIESRFNLPSAQDRYRRRVYFKAHGSLYVLCFDAIPYTQWDSVKDGFQQILDSIKVED
jgi:hypothetical protein